MWTCPTCGRAFKTQNQWHSCASISPDDLLRDLPMSVNALYKHLLQSCRIFCDFSVDTTKSCIYLVDEHRFLVIKPKMNGLILEFAINRREEIFPVIKTVEIGKGRIVHRIKIDDTEELTQEILSWIKEAYHLLHDQ